MGFTASHPQHAQLNSLRYRLMLVLFNLSFGGAYPSEESRLAVSLVFVRLHLTALLQPVTVQLLAVLELTMSGIEVAFWQGQPPPTQALANLTLQED